jgi:transposase-like protein
MYLAGVSLRRVEDVTEVLWGTRVSASAVSELNQKIYVKIEEWRERPLEGEYPYVYLDGVWLKRSWGGETRNVSVLVAVAVNAQGHREIIGAAEGMKEDKESWLAFLRWLKGRGLKGVRLAVSDCCGGLVESLGEVFPEAGWQRCTVHFMRNVWSKVPREKAGAVAAMLKALFAQEDIGAAREKAKAVEAKLREMRYGAAADVFAAGVEDTLTYLRYPPTHRRSLHTNNPLERIMREIRRRTRVVGAFPDGKSALMLVCARLRHIAASRWGERRYLDMGHLWELEARRAGDEAETAGEAA